MISYHAMTFVHMRLDIVNEPVRPLLFTIPSHLLYQGKVFLYNPMKGAGFCLLYQGFYYIESQVYLHRICL